MNMKSHVIHRSPCPSFNKHHKNKDKDSYKINDNHTKDRMVYITWEDESFSSSSSSSSNDEFANLCLMTHKKSIYLKIYGSDSDFKQSYNQLSKSFREIHADVLGIFKKTSHKRKFILKLEKEICDLNSALEFLKEAHTSLVSKHLYV